MAWFSQSVWAAKDNEFHYVMQKVYRFCEYDDVQAEILSRAIVPLSFEHECYTDFTGPKTLNLAKRPADAVALMKRGTERWCERLDAVDRHRASYEFRQMEYLT